jgi:hypothetical protein
MSFVARNGTGTQATTFYKIKDQGSDEALSSKKIWLNPRGMPDRATAFAEGVRQ